MLSQANWKINHSALGLAYAWITTQQMKSLLLFGHLDPTSCSQPATAYNIMFIACSLTCCSGAVGGQCRILAGSPSVILRWMIYGRNMEECKQGLTFIRMVDSGIVGSCLLDLKFLWTIMSSCMRRQQQRKQVWVQAISIIFVTASANRRAIYLSVSWSSCVSWVDTWLSKTAKRGLYSHWVVLISDCGHQPWTRSGSAWLARCIYRYISTFIKHLQSRVWLISI